MTERFKKAYDSLIKAYFEGTLAKGTCVGCACGNIIFDAVGRPVKKEASFMCREYEAHGLWSHKRTFVHNRYVAHPKFENEVNWAGYTAAEFAKIETAFEKNTKISFNMYSIYKEQAILEDQYNGLCAVVDVLMELDQHKENTEELKSKFREHPRLVNV